MNGKRRKAPAAFHEAARIVAKLRPAFAHAGARRDGGGKVVRHAPPSNRVVYTKLKGDIIQVRYHWCDPTAQMNAMLVAWMGADSVRGRGEYFQYEAGSDGKPNFHGSTGAMPPSDEPVEYWEWEEFRRMEHLSGHVSPVLVRDEAAAEAPGA